MTQKNSNMRYHKIMRGETSISLLGKIMTKTGLHTTACLLISLSENDTRNRTCEEYLISAFITGIQREQKQPILNSHDNFIHSRTCEIS